MKTIAIGCDDAGLELKKIIIDHIKSQGYECKDYGVHDNEKTHYPEIALSVAKAIALNECERGILICGTGLGMAIVANKVGGVRAATCHDTYSAERARKSNNAQIITFGARVIGAELAKKIVDAWLQSEFAGGGSTAKVELIDKIDEEYRKVVK